MNSRLFLTVLAGAAVALPAPAASRYTRHQAVNMCKDAVRQQAMEKFGATPVRFRTVNVASNPGPNDWITGSVRIGRGRDSVRGPFTCSADFSTGSVRSVQLQGALLPGAVAQAVSPPAIAPATSPAVMPASPPAAAVPATSPARARSDITIKETSPAVSESFDNSGEADREMESATSILPDSCEQAAARQMKGDGYGRAAFKSVNLWINADGTPEYWGTVRGNGWYQAKKFGYQCTMDTNGNVLSSSVALGR